MNEHSINAGKVYASSMLVWYLQLGTKEQVTGSVPARELPYELV